MDDVLVGRLASELSADQGGPVTIAAVVPMSGGACQELYRVDAEINGVARRMVLRADATSSLPGSLGRKDEYEVIAAAVERGVRTPDVRCLMADVLRPGCYAYLMDWADGIALGNRMIRDPRLAEARKTLPTSLAQALVGIHSIRRDTHAELSLTAIPFRDDAVTTAVDFMRQMLDAMAEPHPAMEFGLKWVRDNAPEQGPPVLVHGDFRTGNFLVTPDGLAAVLDWEFAHWGDPAEDIAWLCMRDWRFARVDLGAGGFATRSAFYKAYEEASGMPVDPAVVHFWEVVANLRWGAGAVYQGERYLAGQETDFEYLAIARRVNEMEYEILRLIENGPSI